MIIELGYSQPFEGEKRKDVKPSRLSTVGNEHGQSGIQSGIVSCKGVAQVGGSSNGFSQVGPTKVEAFKSFLFSENTKLIWWVRSWRFGQGWNSPSHTITKPCLINCRVAYIDGSSSLPVSTVV